MKTAQQNMEMSKSCGTIGTLSTHVSLLWHRLLEIWLLQNHVMKTVELMFATSWLMNMLPKNCLRGLSLISHEQLILHITFMDSTYYFLLAYRGNWGMHEQIYMRIQENTVWLMCVDFS